MQAAIPDTPQDAAPPESPNAISTDVSDAPLQTAGATLRAAREAAGLSVDEAARALFFKPSYVSAMEDMYGPGLPKGKASMYVRAYASFLDLPDAALADAFNRECGFIAHSEEKAPDLTPTARAGGAAKAMVGGLAAAALVVVGVAAAMMFDDGGQTSGADALGATRNAAKESLFTEIAASAAPAQLPLRLVALRRAELEVRGTDGTRYIGRALAAGEDYFPAIGRGWTVSAPTDGGAFEWRVDDIVVGLLGQDGAATYAVSVDAVAAEAEKAASPAIAEAETKGVATN
ncbi:MAG: helix-turn-helix domain-containing protein [Pseudomonadota bacterium]